MLTHIWDTDSHGYVDDRNQNAIESFQHHLNIVRFINIQVGYKRFPPTTPSSMRSFPSPENHTVQPFPKRATDDTYHGSSPIPSSSP